MKTRNVVTNTASELYIILLNIYTTQYDEFLIAPKENIYVLDKLENLKLELYSDEDEMLTLKKDKEEVK